MFDEINVYFPVYIIIHTWHIRIVFYDYWLFYIKHFSNIQKYLGKYFFDYL